MEQPMPVMRYAMAMTIALLAMTATPQAQTAPMPGAEQAYAQADKPSRTARVKRWTQSRFEAAKKKWAQDNAKFAECSKQLEAAKAKARMRISKQVDFMEDCMRQKP
jgi:hypothetical protein